MSLFPPSSLSLSLSLSLSHHLHHHREDPKLQHNLSKKKKKNPTQKLIPNPKQTHNHVNLAATKTTRQPLTQSSSRRCHHRRHPLLLSSPIAISIHPKPICSHQLLLIIIIIFTETHYQTNTETHHQTHWNKTPNPSEKITTTRPKSNPPNTNQIRPKCRKPTNKPTETHEQTHTENPWTNSWPPRLHHRSWSSLHDIASMPLKKKEQEEERAERMREKDNENYELMREEREEPNRLKNNFCFYHWAIVLF